jgi:hypothetical protein
MPIHDYMHCQVQLLGYLKKGILCTMMKLLTQQEKIEQIFCHAEEASAKVCGDAQSSPGQAYISCMFL